MQSHFFIQGIPPDGYIPTGMGFNYPILAQIVLLPIHVEYRSGDIRSDEGGHFVFQRCIDLEREFISIFDNLFPGQQAI
jgi:hypothetical protein